MTSFFSPKGRMSVSRPLALTLNTLNMLAPTLLILAVILVLSAKFSSGSQAVKDLLTTYAIILTAAALIIRVGWGIAIRTIKKRTQQ